MKNAGNFSMGGDRAGPVNAHKKMAMGANPGSAHIDWPGMPKGTTGGVHFPGSGQGGTTGSVKWPGK